MVFDVLLVLSFVLFECNIDCHPLGICVKIKIIIVDIAIGLGVLIDTSCN